jgi:acetylornithine deacetylase/succinyl-diaminopimelate desuccinylase-like protein
VTPDASRITRIRNALDETAALALLKRAVAAPSVTGDERAFVELLAEELRALGAGNIVVKDFAPGRPNVTARLAGAGLGPRLLLTGHTDTVHVRGWAERWAGTERADPFGGAVVGGEIWGRGAGDLKAGICTTLAAARLVREAGLGLPREILFAFVGDEESGEPNSGVSAGMKALASDIRSGLFPCPDIAVYVEPTQLNVYAAQMGFLICDIAITGKSAYFGVPELGVDALKAGHAVLSALWAHSAALGRLAPHPLVGRPFLLVTEVRAGGYIAVPGECRISLILKLIPGQSLDDAKAALEAAARSAPLERDVRIAFNYPAGRDHPVGGTPTETPEATPFVRLLTKATRAVRPDRGVIEGAPFWSEAPFLVALGVPTVYCAPGDIRNCHTLEERVEVREYFDGIVAMAAFLAALAEEDPVVN